MRLVDRIGNSGDSGDEIRDYLEANYRDQGFDKTKDWIPINILEDSPGSFFSTDYHKDSQMMTHVDKVRDFIEEKIKANPAYFKDGINLVCHSQGAVICRGLVTIWNNHNIKTLVSLAGPQQGISDYRKIANMIKTADYIRRKGKGWRLLRNLLAMLGRGTESTIVYTAFQKQFQRYLTFPGYWKPQKKSRYARYQIQSKFLSLINNEFPENPDCPKGFWTRLKRFGTCGKHCSACGLKKCEGGAAKCVPNDRFGKNEQFYDNFGRLEAAIFLGSETDGEIGPYQSTTLGYWSPDDESKVVPYQETLLGKRNLLPLSTMLGAKCGPNQHCAKIVAYMQTPEGCKSNPATNTPGFSCRQNANELDHNSFLSPEGYKHKVDTVKEYVEFLMMPAFKFDPMPASLY